MHKMQPEMEEYHQNSWDIFTPEVAWFIYDFFRYELNGYEKLIFYSYYVNAMTLAKIAESADCSFQNIGLVVKRIEKKLHRRWITKEEWIKDDSQRTDKQCSAANKRRN
jgi:predicted DNA-binding protein YlxM (UPF0122 family)